MKALVVVAVVSTVDVCTRETSELDPLYHKILETLSVSVLHLKVEDTVFTDPGWEDNRDVHSTKEPS